MFNKMDTASPAAKEAETIIGESVIVKGNFSGQGNIIIEGEVGGNVKTKKFLLVRAKAKILASIEAKSAKIAGIINGNVLINEYLEVESTAKINGDIKCAQLSIAKGAIVNGHINMAPPLQPTKQAKLTG